MAYRENNPWGHGCLLLNFKVWDPGAIRVVPRCAMADKTTQSHGARAVGRFGAQLLLNKAGRAGPPAQGVWTVRLLP